MKRRNFLQQTIWAAGSIVLSQPFSSLAAETEGDSTLVILHTNDVHSRLEPFPMDGGRNAGLGGVAQRATLIQQIRNEHKHVLLLDAGDIFQGTPYFNFYKGEPEIKAMRAMQYDACTMGNHDFDGGIENFATQMQWGGFPVLCANYDFTGTAMEGKSVPYKIFKRGSLRIGVFGLGIELQGLVPDNLRGNTKYFDPVQKASETASRLKRREKCDFVICLSHLGYDYKGENKISDRRLAADTEFIDLIIGGHTHTFLNEPQVVKNKQNADVVINQVGWGGIILGRLDYSFSQVGKKNFFKSHSVVIEKKTTA